MAITGYSISTAGGVTTVTATSDLSGVIFFHWYVDGGYVGFTASASRSFVLPAGEQAEIEAIDTNDEDFDPVAESPSTYPSRRTLEWARSTDTDVASYTIEERKNAGSWTTVAAVAAETGRWAYTFTTGRLDDLTSYEWRITPVDAAGNSGTALTIGPELIIRRPDAPDFAIAFNAGTTKVTFSEAV